VRVVRVPPSSVGVLASLCAISCSVGAGPAKQAGTPQAEVERVMREGMDFARNQLEAHGEFMPFAYILHAEGRVEFIPGPHGLVMDPVRAPELEFDPAQALSELTQRVAREAAAARDFRVVGIFSDTQIALRDGERSDAIQAGMEHASGYCTEVYTPYSLLGEGELTFGERVTTARKGSVFKCK
jgi:hypothetical protein